MKTVKITLTDKQYEKYSERARAIGSMVCRLGIR